MTDKSLKCWLCSRVIGTFPDSFNAVWDLTEKDPEPKAICEGCRDTYNKIAGQKTRPVKDSETVG